MFAFGATNRHRTTAREKTMASTDVDTRPSPSCGATRTSQIPNHQYPIALGSKNCAVENRTAAGALELCSKILETVTKASERIEA